MPSNDFNYLYYGSKYKHMSTQKQVIYIVYAIYVPNVTCKVLGCLYTAHGQYLRTVYDKFIFQHYLILVILDDD